MSTENKVEGDVTNVQSSYVAPAQRDLAELTAALEKEGLVAPKIDPKAAPTQPSAEAPKTAEATPERKSAAAEAPAKAAEEPRLLKLARDKDAQRKAVEQRELDTAKPYLDALKVLSPIEASALAKAKQLGDPIAALTALGFTHSQYTSRLLGQALPEGNVPKKEDATEPAESPKLVELERQVAELRREREITQAQQLHGNIREIVKRGDKTPSLATMEELGYNTAGEIENIIKDFYARTGSLPGNSFEETVEIAAESLELHYQKQLELLQNVNSKRNKLTTGTNSASVAPEVPESPQAGAEKPRTLTNASVSHPGAPRTVPKTINERMQAFIERGESVFEEK